MYLLEQKYNTDTSQQGFPVKFYIEDLSHELFFISHTINMILIIRSIKKFVVICIVRDNMLQLKTKN